MKRISLFLTAAVLAVGCNDNNRKTETETTETETAAMEDTTENNNELIDLFNGENLNGWKVYNSDADPTQWSVEDGALAFAPSEGERSGTENIISEEEFSNFELSLEWKISEGGNSGIMWGVKESDSLGEPYLTGPEIQVLDNEKHPDAANGPIRQAGALYDMAPPSEDVTKPVGEWNETVIRINHKENLGSVTMNGTKIVEFALHGEEWDKLKENSKFKDWTEFGKYHSGHIALQDHGDKVWYRNIKIKELD